MDSTLLPQVDLLLSTHLIPYAIILVNYIFFKLLRSLVNKTFARLSEQQPDGKQASTRRKNDGGESGLGKVLLLFLEELISTLDLCVNCAELNIILEKNGTVAYGLTLLLLTYLWIDAFGDATTSPGYLVESHFFEDEIWLMKSARFMGQALAMPLAWRFASFFWKYKLLDEHERMLLGENCKSALNTSTINGFLVEFTCCLVCRLLELVGHKLLERKHLSQRLVSLITSFVCTALVVVALEITGGYFNPVLAASLEYGCLGINLHQHAIVFWLGPLLAHLAARGLFKRFVGEQQPQQHQSRDQHHRTLSSKSRRLARANSRKKRADKID